MSKILCPNRGGEASYLTQDKAIALEKERGDSLLFLFVVGIQFLDKMAVPIMVNVVKDEITKMGEFLLLMAKERAAKQGVEVKTTCRTGKVPEEIKNAARESGASLVVLGRMEGDESVFHTTDLDAFAAEIEVDTGVKTIVV